MERNKLAKEMIKGNEVNQMAAKPKKPKLTVPFATLMRRQQPKTLYQELKEKQARTATYPSKAD